jgi:hypothetical protein
MLMIFEACVRETAWPTLSCVIWHVRRIAKSDYQLHHVKAVRPHGKKLGSNWNGFSLN